MNLLKSHVSRRKTLTPQQRAVDLIAAIDAGGIPLNPAVVNDIARKLGLEVSVTAQMDETIARIRVALENLGKQFMGKANLLCNIPADLPEELVQQIETSAGISIERIVSKGHQSPPDFWYDQDQNEWVLLAKGEAKLQFQDQTLHLKAGDYLNIPAHQKHRVAWTTPDEETVWLAIFYG